VNIKNALFSVVVNSSYLLNCRMHTVHYQNRNQLKIVIGDKLKSGFDSGCKIFDINLIDVSHVRQPFSMSSAG
jgi:hypothetical protein